MPKPAVTFDSVWKKFRRGERHDSLRDLIPALARRALGRRPTDALADNEFWALENVSFEVEPGKAVGIIGANGAGKSTTLKLLTKILKPNRGRSIVRGRVGALIEVAAGFHPDLTGRENVYLQGAIMGMRRTDIAKRFDEIVDFAGVGPFIDTPVKRYSSGMNARLGFSIAAHLSPDVLIIDEVLSVGDIAFQAKCFERMVEYKRQGVAVVVVSHNLQAIATLCEETVYLAHHVEAAGPTPQVLDAYVRNSRRAAKTIPSGVTLVSATLLDSEGHAAPQFDVAPGTGLTLRAVVQTERPLDDVVFGFLVHRSTDQLLVYDGNVQRRDLSPSPLAGEFTIDFHFRANFVRGHYAVSFHALDTQQQRFVLYVDPAATVVVSETVTWGGVADVEMSAALAGGTVSDLSARVAS